MGDHPVTVSPTITYAANQCGHHKACFDLGSVGLKSNCCPYSADGLTAASINLLLEQGVLSNLQIEVGVITYIRKRLIMWVAQATQHRSGKPMRSGQCMGGQARLSASSA